MHFQHILLFAGWVCLSAAFAMDWHGGWFHKAAAVTAGVITVLTFMAMLIELAGEPK